MGSIKKKKAVGVPRWCEWTTPDGIEVPAVPCGRVFKGRKEKLKSQQTKELKEIRREYI